MNTQDFQNICASLHAKYDERRLTDTDVDAFADVITNVLGRDDLRAKDTEYEKLAGRINHDYENDIAMNPLLARMYELCRMHAMYRPRPLTEMERKEEQLEVGKTASKKYPVCFSISNGKKVIASVWWENLGGMDEIADKVSVIAPILPSLQDGVDLRPQLLEVLSKADAGIDPLDTDVLGDMEDIFGCGNVPVSSDPSKGIIALDEAGVERNRVRKGANVKFSLKDRTVSMDAYMVYGKTFYRQLTGIKEDSPIATCGELTSAMTAFDFMEARRAKEQWATVGEVFGIPGSDNLVGTKKPLPV